MNKKYHYYHISGDGHTEGIYKVPKGKLPPLGDGICIGPFNTFCEARNDAVDFHRHDMDMHKMAAQDASRLRQKDIILIDGVQNE